MITVMHTDHQAIQPPDPARAAACARLLESVARGLRSGLSLSAALTSACEPRRVHDALRTDDVDPRVANAVRRHTLGEPLAVSLDAARATCRQDEALRLTLTVLRTAAGHGGASAEALDRAASTLRQHAALAADAHTQAAPARLSATMLTISPIAFSAGAAVLDAEVRRVLLATPVGWICATAGLALSLAGRRWMTRLVKGVR